jgi:hypothetical protein
MGQDMDTTILQFKGGTTKIHLHFTICELPNCVGFGSGCFPIPTRLFYRLGLGWIVDYLSPPNTTAGLPLLDGPILPLLDGIANQPGP